MTKKSARLWNGSNEAGGAPRNPPPAFADSSSGEAQLEAIFGEVMGVDEGTIEGRTRVREDLGCDSLDLEEVATKMGEEMAIEIPEDYELEKLATVDDWVRMAVRRGLRAGETGPPVRTGGKAVKGGA